MKLDIGSAELAIDADVHIDITKPYDENGQTDILADAHRLPLKDETFDEVFSGACLVCYTSDEAIAEAVRILKPSGTIKFRIQCLYLGRLIKKLYDEQMHIESIEEMNYAVIDDGQNELEEVILVAKKGMSNWYEMEDEPQEY